jgi:hypothetical protein
MRLFFFFLCLCVGVSANAAEYQPLERVIGSLHDWSHGSIQFSRYRWEQQSRQVTNDIQGALIEFDGIPVYAPDIQVVEGVATFSAQLNLNPVEGRSFAAYDQSCRYTNTEVTIQDHLKSTALTLAGQTAISGRGSITSIDFANCTTRVTVALHAWNEAASTSPIASPRIEPPPAMRRELPPSHEARSVSRAQHPDPVVRPTRSVKATRTQTTTSSGAYSPARLQDSVSLDFPREPHGDLMVSVKCEASVTRRGTVQRLRCWGDRTDPFVSSIQAALEDMRFAPALVNGKSSPVVVPMAVRFSRSGDVQQIEVFENHALRANYTAPQRYKTGTSWTCGSPALWQTLEVSEDGRVESVDIDPASASTRCVEGIARKRLKDRYIPAMDDGTPVNATLVAIFES